jgi:ferredoxin
MAKIHFKKAGITIEVRDGTTVFAAALAGEVAIPSQCGGRCACALCRVRIVDGAEFVSPMGWDEADHMGNCFHLTGERLSCQSRVYGDVVVEIDAVDTSQRQRTRYIPPALVRKREKMEQEEELRRVRGEGSSSGAQSGSRKTSSEPSKRAAAGGSSNRSDSPPRAGSRRKKHASRKRRGRNPGSLKPGSTRPPPGAKSKKDD